MTPTVHSRAAPVVLLAVAAALVAGSPGAPRPSLALINVSPSVPEGLYVRVGRTEIVPGDVVAVRQPATARAYLSRLGVPEDLRLLKRVAASAGAHVCVSQGVLRWPGGAAFVLARDRRGVPLPAWSGCRKLAHDELLLLGDTASSFDSRYFGPVRRAAIEGVFHEVLRW